jgi:hypothetical protein
MGEGFGGVVWVVGVVGWVGWGGGGVGLGGSGMIWGRLLRRFRTRSTIFEHFEKREREREKKHFENWTFIFLNVARIILSVFSASYDRTPNI